MPDGARGATRPTIHPTLGEFRTGHLAHRAAMSPHGCRGRNKPLLPRIPASIKEITKLRRPDASTDDLLFRPFPNPVRSVDCLLSGSGDLSGCSRDQHPHCRNTNDKARKSDKGRRFQGRDQLLCCPGPGGTGNHLGLTPALETPGGYCRVSLRDKSPGRQATGWDPEMGLTPTDGKNRTNRETNILAGF